MRNYRNTYHALLCPHVGMIIGFDDETYHVREDGGTATLTVKVLSGMLSEAMTVDFTTQSGSAVGELFKK